MFKTERKIFLFVVFRQQDSAAIPFLNIIKNFIKSPHYFKNFLDNLAFLKIAIKIINQLLLLFIGKEEMKNKQKN